MIYLRSIWLGGEVKLDELMSTLHEGCYRIWIEMMLGSKEVVESASCWHSIAFPMWTEEYSSSHFWSIPSFTDICMQRHFIQVLQGERWLIIQIAHESWPMGEFFSFFLFFFWCVWVGDKWLEEIPPVRLKSHPMRTIESCRPQRLKMGLSTPSG